MKPKLAVYIAGFFDTRARLLEIRTLLEKLGLTVTSEWLDEAPKNYIPGQDTIKASNTTDAYARRCAQRDKRDINRAHFVIVDTIDVTPRGGREWEGGYAEGIGRRVMVVGPRRNVFHYTVSSHFETWEEALSYIAQAMEHGDGRDN